MNNASKYDALYRLVRSDMEAMGASRTTIVAMNSYVDAIQRLQCGDGELQKAILELNAVIKNTEPKIIPLLHLIEAFEIEMISLNDKGLVEGKAHAIDILRQKRLQFETATEQMIDQCTRLIKPSDLISVLSPSAHIREALIRAKSQRHIPFSVLVLNNTSLRTGDLIRALKQHGFEHEIIPVNSLTHYTGDITKLLIGAVSVSADGRAVTTIGTANVVSLCRAYHIPVYLIIQSLKFAHTSLPEQHIYKEQTRIRETDLEYHLTTFSHDIVDLELIDHIITENGERPWSPSMNTV